MAINHEAQWLAAVTAEKNGEGTRFACLPGSGVDDRIFVYPDIHFPYQNKEFLAYLDEMCDAFKPTHIIYIGDLLDCYSMSSFDKDPARKETLNDERNAAVAWLVERRKSHPDAEHHFILGNHEHRITRQIRRYLPGLHDMPELSIEGLLRLKELRIHSHPMIGLRLRGIRFKHGESTAVNSPKVEMLAHRCDGISGHVHRKMHASFKDKEGLYTEWWSTGHACDMDMVDYTVAPNWTLHTLSMVITPSGEKEIRHYEG